MATTGVIGVRRFLRLSVFHCLCLSLDSLSLFLCLCLSLKSLSVSLYSPSVCLSVSLSILCFSKFFVCVRLSVCLRLSVSHQSEQYIVRCPQRARCLMEEYSEYTPFDVHTRYLWILFRNDGQLFQMSCLSLSLRPPPHIPTSLNLSVPVCLSSSLFLHDRLFLYHCLCFDLSIFLSLSVSLLSLRRPYSGLKVRIYLLGAPETHAITFLHNFRQL